MFIGNVWSKKVTASSGIVGTHLGRYAVFGDSIDGYLSVVAYRAFNENTLYLNSYFVSGYSGSNYAGEKGIVHCGIATIKAICELDKSFYVAYGKAQSRDCNIKVVEFGRDNSVVENYE